MIANTCVMGGLHDFNIFIEIILVYIHIIIKCDTKNKIISYMLLFNRIKKLYFFNNTFKKIELIFWIEHLHNMFMQNNSVGVQKILAISIEFVNISYNTIIVKIIIQKSIILYNFNTFVVKLIKSFLISLLHLNNCQLFVLCPFRKFFFLCSEQKFHQVVHGSYSIVKVCT